MWYRIRHFGWRNLAQLAVLLALPTALAGSVAAETKVRSDPNGPVLFIVDGPEVRTEQGKRLLFIDENSIRPVPGGPRFLVVEGNDLRNEPGGVRIAVLDDTSVRRAGNTPPLLTIDGTTIKSPDGGQLLLSGDALSKPQLAAVLFQWKRELFRLSEQEIAALKAQMAAAGQAAESAIDNMLSGDFKITNSNIGSMKQGTATIAKQGEYFAVNFDFGNGNKLSGIGLKRKVLGVDELWVSLGTKGDVAIGIYESAGGLNVQSQWIPVAAMKQGASVLGNENMTGAAGGSFSGDYTISTAQATFGKGGFSGTLRMAGIQKTDSGLELLPRELQWTIGATKITGIATAVEVVPGRLVLAAASASDPMFVIGRIFQTEAGSTRLEFCTNAKAMGYVLIEK